MFLIDVEQLRFVHDHQRAVLRWINSRFGFCLVITSIYRIDDDGVHGQLPCRGTDLRCLHDGIGQLIADEINAHWQYDPQRPEMKVAIYHDVGFGKHLHIQTHPRTREL